MTEVRRNPIRESIRVQPSIVPSTHAPFLPSEDQQLYQLVAAYGTKHWPIIASHFANRTPKQCRERWFYHLNPAINRGPWTAREDQILINKHNELGNRWTEIAKSLPGRTDSSVKSRWNSALKQQSKNDFERPKFVLMPVWSMDFSSIPPFVIRQENTKME
jgi:hypothetical protein